MPPASPLSLPVLAALALVTPLGAQDERAHKLFHDNCAQCHGETGDGKGWAQLDRPARSFMDGGFSFGNTPEALFRTISVGIPGTPMPAFDSALKDEDRKLLASFVVTLGPPVEEVKSEDTILAVHERPLVIRGMLPPIAEGLPVQPRALLVGDPSGISFEYRTDDVRLLGLLQGGFVERTDWTGRGGTPLQPLGKVVHLVDGGKPEPLFSLAAGAIPLHARLSYTRSDGEVVLGYHLELEGRELAHVDESPRVETTALGTGFVRHLRLTAGAQRIHLALTDATQGPGEEIFAHSGRDERSYASARRDERGAVEYRTLTLEAPRWSRKQGALIVELEPLAHATVELTTLPLGEWNDKVKTQLERLGR